MKKKTEKERGLIKTIVLIIIALALIKIVWDYDVLNLLDNPVVRRIIDALLRFLRAIWDFIQPAISLFK